MNPKRALQRLIRGCHKIAACPGVPPKVALYFHELEDAQYPAFAECISYWTDQGYRFVDAWDFIARDDEKLLFVSFDDNFQSWHRALSLFESLGLQATFYMNTLPVRDDASAGDIERYYDRIHHQGERVPLSKGEIRSLAAAGHTIGCHSHSHFDLGSTPQDEAEAEILISKQILEAIVGNDVLDFSYPFGMRRNFTEGLRDFCLQNGFRTVCNAIPGRLHETPTARFLNRTPWDLGQSLDYNITNIMIDGRVFEGLTGRSAVI
ncbi:MAG: polysaccharide deacetylase family protein [Alphaproteobacteria bacterium]|nr:polysaccharide deacetylase family protein [Alphaproteobacteria bacterium]